MGRVQNRRGKKSRTARKHAFRSHDPQGRNSAPSKTDDSVLSTIPDLKIRAVSEPTASEGAIPMMAEASNSLTKVDRHAEMKQRGLEKKRLLAALAPTAVKLSVTQHHIIQKSLLPVRKERLVEKIPKKRTQLALFKDQDPVTKSADVVVKTSLDPTKTVHSEKKRKKMREREKAKREKVRAKKEAKADKIEKKRIDNKPKFNETIERPSESIRELGSKLAQKLGKESKSLISAYDGIKKGNRNAV